MSDQNSSSSEPSGPTCSGRGAPSAPELPLRTTRLLLRPYRPDDVEAVLGYYSDADVSRYLLTAPFSRTDAERVVTQRLAQVAPSGPGDGLALVVEHRGEVVGDVVLTLLGSRPGRGELGWVFAPWAGGRGLATEAVRALLELGFDHYGLHRVIAQTDARNTASARLCARLGMRREAHLRRDWWSKGEWTDTLVYGLLREELAGADPGSTRGC